MSHDFTISRPTPSRRLSALPVPFTAYAVAHVLAGTHRRVPFVLRAWTYGNAFAALVAALVVR